MLEYPELEETNLANANENKDFEEELPIDNPDTSK